MQKTEESTCDLIGNKIGDKITSISKSPQNASKKFHSKTGKLKKYISPEKRQQIIEELRLV